MVLEGGTFFNERGTPMHDGVVWCSEAVQILCVRRERVSKLDYQIDQSSCSNVFLRITRLQACVRVIP